jgi:hypothetical protein
VRIDRRVSPNQIGIWTVAELVSPRRPESLLVKGVAVR